MPTSMFASLNLSGHRTLLRSDGDGGGGDSGGSGSTDSSVDLAVSEAAASLMAEVSAPENASRAGGDRAGAQSLASRAGLAREGDMAADMPSLGVQEPSRNASPEAPPAGPSSGFGENSSVDVALPEPLHRLFTLLLYFVLIVGGAAIVGLLITIALAPMTVMRLFGARV